MATEVGEAYHSLIGSLTDEGPLYSFFQAIRLIQALHPESPKVGFQGPPQKESVRLTVAPDLSFAASDIKSINRDLTAEGSERFVIETTFLGMFGSSSPLPTYYSEEILHAPEESLLKVFLDLFHHRFLSLLYRIWEKYRYTIQFAAKGKDFFSQRLMALMNVMPDLFPPDHQVNPMRFLAFSGLLTQQPRSAAALQGMIRDYFPEVNVELEPCIGQWMTVPADQQNRLGAANSTLGDDFTVGDRVMDRSGTFRISVGPMGLDDFIEFLPSGDKMIHLREITDLFVSDCLDYEIELIINKEEIPVLKLGSPTARLGWSSWMGSEHATELGVRFLQKGWLHGRR